MAQAMANMEKLPAGELAAMEPRGAAPAGVAGSDAPLAPAPPPRKDGHSRQRSPATGQGRAARQERIRLVLADDARDLLERECSFFPAAEFEVTLARNGCEAYNLVKAIAPEVVFLDLFMPLLNGEECCRLIKSDLHLRDTRVVLVAPDEERQLQRCYGAQCDLVVTKPIRRRSFIEAVHALMGELYRVPARWPVRVVAELHDEGQCRLRSWTVNLSEQGAYLESSEMLPRERNYTLRLQLADDELPPIPARIAWLNPGGAPRDRRLPPGFGLQFFHLDGDTRSRLRKVLEETAGPEALSRSGRETSLRMFVELPMLTGKKL